METIQAAAMIQLLSYGVRNWMDVLSSLRHDSSRFLLLCQLPCYVGDCLGSGGEPLLTKRLVDFDRLTVTGLQSTPPWMSPSQPTSLAPLAQ